MVLGTVYVTEIVTEIVVTWTHVATAAVLKENV